MLFNSAEFLFIFLPAVMFAFHLAQRYHSIETSLKVLAISSVIFYGWWQPIYLILLSISIIGNFYIAKSIYLYKSKFLCILAVLLNLASIVYYKYANFLMDNIENLLGRSWQIEQILLPLAISFFTFQQIAYIVDVYKNNRIESNLTNYVLFVTFFPQLIAGPIVHHGVMMPQFANPERLGIRVSNVAVGLSIFAIGLFKKTVLADNVAAYANPVFNSVDAGSLAPDFFLAWGAAIGYTMQLYFDFSGYSDMAIGLALLFGIALPLNFNSPYKATSIIEFWRRWHITLSHFLRDYLYIALGGNRKGNIRRYVNLFLTMLLGGLWHGAGWNFLIWGALHGTYLIINHGYTAIKPFIAFKLPKPISTFFYWILTFIAVVVGWVFFRASSLDGALTILAGMFGLNGFQLPTGILTYFGEHAAILQVWGVQPSIGGGMNLINTWIWGLSLLVVAVALPNVHDLFYQHLAVETQLKHPPKTSFIWKPTRFWAIFTAALLLIGLSTLGQVSEFLYFNF